MKPQRQHHDHPNLCNFMYISHTLAKLSWLISPQFWCLICNHCFLANTGHKDRKNSKPHVLICCQEVYPVTCHVANHWKDETWKQVVSSLERIISSGIMFLFIRGCTLMKFPSIWELFPFQDLCFIFQSLLFREQKCLTFQEHRSILCSISSCILVFICPITCSYFYAETTLVKIQTVKTEFKAFCKASSLLSLFRPQLLPLYQCLHFHVELRVTGLEREPAFFFLTFRWCLLERLLRKLHTL